MRVSGAAMLFLALAFGALLPGATAFAQEAQPSAEHPIGQESRRGSAQQPAEGPLVEGEAGEHPPELPNLIHLIYRAFTRPAAPGLPPRQAPRWIEILHHFQSVFYSLLAAGILIVIVRIGSRRMKLIPGPVQTLVEAFVDGFHAFLFGILGPSGERYIPFLGSVFLYILFMNLFGLVPLMFSPTSLLSTTASLAIVVFFYVQWIGLRRLGVANYLKHLAGDPQDKFGWALVPLMIPLHLISELARPVSLALRLFGNILGEDVLIGVFAGLGVAMVSFVHSPVGLPLDLPFVLLAMVMSTVQALVFTLLSTIYIMLALPHEEVLAGHPEEAAVRAAGGGDLERGILSAPSRTVG